ncbi:MAG: VWA domain-containing protein [Verrucomicrobia bacterium]|nr:MAG: VWA domain-containing protein [Verrucomicrobiota bacterium]
MSFATPLYLALLAVGAPLLLVFLVWTWRLKQKAVAQFVRSRLLAQLTVGVSAWRQQAKRAMLYAAALVLLLALARPRIGFDEQEAHGSGLDIIVCFDVSRSMAATDIKPDRLTRAKLAAQDLAKSAKGDRLGLVPFAGTAFLQCPLALDPEAFRQSVGALDTETIPDPGTAMVEAIREARMGFRQESGATRVILVMTDGEDHEPRAVEAAKEAYADGIRVFTIGIGTPAGEVLRTADPYGNPVFVRDETGNPVRSRLNEKLLADVAAAGGGFYLPMQNAQTMRTLYERGLAPLPRGDFAGGKVRQWHERFQWPLALAVVLLLAEFLYPEVRRAAAMRPSDGAGDVGSNEATGGKR